MAIPIPCGGPADEDQVIDLDRLLEARACRRLPWWRAQGFAPAAPGPEAKLPAPWPEFPPGWRGPGRGWGRPFLDAPPEWGLRTRADWLLEQGGLPQLVFLGPPTPTLRLRAQFTGALLMLRGNPEPELGWQGLSLGGIPATWLCDWPEVRRLRLPMAQPQALAAVLAGLRRDLGYPWPPPRSAPRARCRDCPASRLCADFY